MVMAMYTKEIGKMEKGMGKENVLMLMAQYMKEIGKMDQRMEKEKILTKQNYSSSRKRGVELKDKEFFINNCQKG